MREQISISEARPDTLVSSFNEWDPLEEVIVGRLEGASVPPWDVTLKATMPEKSWSLFQTSGGKPFPSEQIALGCQELEELVGILVDQGIKVHRPEPLNYSQPFRTPHWSCEGGVYAAMPRDLLLVVGNEIIEAPLSWRCRYFEIDAYRAILKKLFLKGAKWTSAPKPQLLKELYNYNFRVCSDPNDVEYVITEFEPTFDAADFIRCGRDIFVQKSHVTNEFGIEWLRRHLTDEYKIHELKVRDKAPMHIDATFMPLAPGKVLVNPERIEGLPNMFRHWEMLKAPRPNIPESHPMLMSSTWVSMNVLMLDEQRVVVESQETELIRALEDWGFECIPCPFRHVMSFGGAFHCVTLDIKRRGTLQSYF